MKRHWADSSLKCNTLPNRSGVKMTTRYRPLQPENRVTLASLLQQGHSLRSIAKVLERSPSSVSREVARNRSAEGADRIVQAAHVEAALPPRPDAAALGHVARPGDTPDAMDAQHRRGRGDQVTNRFWKQGRRRHAFLESVWTGCR
jgi:hypothetical protein